MLLYKIFFSSLIFRTNRLECVCVRYKPSLIFAGRLSPSKIVGTNTLAYLSDALVTKKKSFMKSTPDLKLKTSNFYNLESGNIWGRSHKTFLA